MLADELDGARRRRRKPELCAVECLDDLPVPRRCTLVARTCVGQRVLGGIDLRTALGDVVRQCRRMAIEQRRDALKDGDSTLRTGEIGDGIRPGDALLDDP